jgi:hypothetical protein
MPSMTSSIARIIIEYANFSELRLFNFLTVVPLRLAFERNS